MSKEELAYIEAYYAGNLSEIERADFELQYKGDPEFAKQVDLFVQAQDAIEALGQRELKAAFHQQYKATTSNVRPLKTRWYIPVAIAAVILLLIAFFLFPKDPIPQSPQDLYAEYSQFEPLSLERGNSASDSLFLLANNHYNSQDFAEAIPILEQLVEDEDFGRKAYAWLHLGISQLRSDQDLAALTSLGKVPENSSFYYQAQWNLALIHLKQGRVDQAKVALRLLQESSRAYGKQAAEMLDKL